MRRPQPLPSRRLLTQPSRRRCPVHDPRPRRCSARSGHSAGAPQACARSTTALGPPEPRDPPAPGGLRTGPPRLTPGRSALGTPCDRGTRTPACAVRCRGNSHMALVPDQFPLMIPATEPWRPAVLMVPPTDASPPHSTNSPVTGADKGHSRIMSARPARQKAGTGARHGSQASDSDRKPLKPNRLCFDSRAPYRDPLVCQSAAFSRRPEPRHILRNHRTHRPGTARHLQTDRAVTLIRYTHCERLSVSVTSARSPIPERIRR